MTVPNFITTIRIILAPIFIIFLINDQFLPALIVFVVCTVSDGLDGMVARLFNQKSWLGAYLDPLADKILLVAAFIALSIRGYLPPWLGVMVITRDILIMLGVLVLFLNSLEFNIRPSILSKANTILQFITVLLVLSKGYMSISLEFYLYVFYVTALLTVGSGLHYIYTWFQMIGDETTNGDNNS